MYEESNTCFRFSFYTWLIKMYDNNKFCYWPYGGPDLDDDNYDDDDDLDIII